ncbi:hypothetical protein PPYR_02611 [Photinus pyralis]|uniref:Uncharacterized protein n=1 Tax=Photinus pyralis TaxID=7054 RepID=A0A1Y1K527_PHOPY|nr:uncharacterized protein LOC116160560 [Photinus pyralis]KAB0805641.1 hypothetical protein PPYR_02611 [Photinus pyralis]
MSYAVSTPTRCEIFMKVFANPRSWLFFFGILLIAVLAITDSFKGVYEIWNVGEDSTTYPGVIINAYVILYITYLHIITITPMLRNLVCLFNLLVLTVLFRLAVFCTFIPIEKTAVAAVSSMIGCVMATMMVFGDFLFIEKWQKGVVEVIEIQDEEILE